MLEKELADLNSAVYIVWTRIDYEGWHPAACATAAEARRLEKLTTGDPVIVTAGAVRL